MQNMFTVKGEWEVVYRLRRVTGDSGTRARFWEVWVVLARAKWGLEREWEVVETVGLWCTRVVLGSLAGHGGRWAAVGSSR